MLPADADFDAFLRAHATGAGFKHVVVTRGNHIAGVVRVNTGLRRGVEQAYSGVHLGDVAQRNFTIAREDDIMFDVVQRMARHERQHGGGGQGRRRGRPSEIIGIISKEHIAEFGRRKHQAVRLTPRASSHPQWRGRSATPSHSAAIRIHLFAVGGEKPDPIPNQIVAR